MSTHPNAILMMVYEHENAAEIFDGEFDGTAYAKKYGAGGIDIEIEDEYFNVMLMDSDYDASMQIEAPEGSLVINKFLTYGYGDTITWARAQELQNILQKFGEALVEKHGGKISCHITANYW